MDESLIPDIVKALEIVALERLDGPSFIVRSDVPDWFKSVHREENLARGSLVNPGQHLVFLDNFLVDAEEFWAGHDAGCIISGLWEENDQAGRALHLEATALVIDGRKILLIAHAVDDYQQTQYIIQRGRENALIHEALVKEIEKKEILLHAIVHDLMGPLTSMNATFDILAEGNLSEEEQKDMLAIGRRVSQEQKAMITQILEAFSADLDSRDISTLLPEEAPDAFGVAHHVVESFFAESGLKNVTLRLVGETVPSRNRRVIADEPSLARVLSNLVENALRHSPAGSVVTVGVKDDGNHVLIHVDDEGTGVSKKLSGALFHNFVKGKEKTGKSGLGLYFCRITVERWGGSIGVSPLPEKGARFWVRLRKPIRQEDSFRGGGASPGRAATARS